MPDADAVSQRQGDWSFFDNPNRGQADGLGRRRDEELVPLPVGPGGDGSGGGMLQNQDRYPCRFGQKIVQVRHSEKLCDRGVHSVPPPSIISAYIS